MAADNIARGMAASALKNQGGGGVFKASELDNDVPFVSASDSQTLTEDQQKKAQENIGLGGLVVSEGGDTLTWDGNTEGLESAMSNLGLPLYKLSNNELVEGDFKNGFALSQTGDMHVNLSGTYADLSESGGFMSDGLVVVYGLIFYAPDDNYTFADDEITVTFPTQGIYILVNGTVTSFSLTIPGYTGFAKKKIKEEYIPESVPQVQTAAVGQTIVVSEVDAEGKPTKWEAKELGSGGFPYDNLELIQSVKFTEETKIFRVDMDYSKYQAVLATVDVNTNDRVHLKLAGNLPVFFDALYNGGTLLIIPFSDTVAFVSYDTAKGSPYGSLGTNQISGAYCAPAGAVLNTFELQHNTTFAVGDKIEVFGIAR